MNNKYRYEAIGGEKRATARKAVWLLSVGAAAALLAFAAVHHDAIGPLSIEDKEEIPVETSSKKEQLIESVLQKSQLQFRLYKIALSSSVGHNNSMQIQHFVNQTLAPVDENFNLGCNGIKVNAYLMPYGPQLHWVQSKVLSNDPEPIEQWQKYFEELNALGEFNAFMHNKVSLFTSDLASPLRLFRTLETPLIYRRSTNYIGKASPLKEVGHLLFEISGRTFELMGPILGARLIKESRAWPIWSASECEPAHRLDPNLDEYLQKYQDYIKSADTIMHDWAQDRGFYPPMLAFVGIAATQADIDTLRPTLYQDLTSIAGLNTILESSTDSCLVYRIPTISSKEFKSPVRYVLNYDSMDKLAAHHKTTVADYNKYIHTTHQQITGSYTNWAGWDHWLDQHIGLKYVGNEASAKAVALNTNLTSSGVPVGQRTTDDYGNVKAVHWYAGYSASMTWEYWVADTASYSINREADVCSCLPSNNGNIFLDKYGSNCTDQGDWFEN